MFGPAELMLNDLALWSELPLVRSVTLTLYPLERLSYCSAVHQ